MVIQLLHPHVFFALRFDAFHGVYKLSWSLLDAVKIEPKIRVWHLSIWWSSCHDCGTYARKLIYKLLKRCPAYGKNHTTLGRHKFARPLRFLDFWLRPSASFKNLESTSVLKIYLYRPRAVLYNHTWADKFLQDLGRFESSTLDLRFQAENSKRPRSWRNLLSATCDITYYHMSVWWRNLSNILFSFSYFHVICEKISDRVQNVFPDQITLSWKVIPPACANVKEISRHVVKNNERWLPHRRCGFAAS